MLYMSSLLLPNILFAIENGPEFYLDLKAWQYISLISKHSNKWNSLSKLQFMMYTPTQTNISNHGKSKINDNNVVTISGIIKKMNTHQNNTRVHKQFVTTVYIYTYIYYYISCMTWHIHKHGDKTTILIHQRRASLSLLTFCRWRHNVLLMTSESNHSTWQVSHEHVKIDI